MNAEWFEALPEQCPQRMRSGAKAVIIELQMVILLQQKIPFRKEKCSQIRSLKD